MLPVHKLERRPSSSLPVLWDGYKSKHVNSFEMEEAESRNLVVNPFERDEAHVECELSEKSFFF